MNVRTAQPAWPLSWAALWLLASSFYLVTLYEPFTPDSYVYVAAARQVNEGGCFCLPFAPTSATSLPAPLSAWPPGYPALISIVTGHGVDPWLASRCIAAASVLLAFVLGALWLSRRSGGWAGLALAAVSSTTAAVSVTAWSEGPFVLALGVAIAALAWLSESTGWRSCSAALLFCVGLAALLLIRHAGWFLLPALVWFAFSSRSANRLKAAGSIVVAALPAALWLAGHNPNAPDTGAALQFQHVVRSTGQTVAAFGKLVAVPWSDPVAWTVIPGLLGICGLALVQWRARGNQSKLTWLLWRCGWSLLAGTWLVGLANPAPFFATDRLLWPAWITLALALGTSLRAEHFHTYRVALVLLLLSQTVGVIRLPALEPRPIHPKGDFHRTGQLLTNQVVVSNEGWRAWRLWGVSGYHLPRAHDKSGVLHPDTLAHWANVRQVQYLLWFEDGLTETESLRRYGPVAGAGYGRPPDVLELVARDSICHTYRIRSSGTP